MISITNHYKLDNPAWYALTEKHQAFAIGTDSVKKYQRYVAPWVAYSEEFPGVLEELDPFIEPDESFYIFDSMPSLPKDYIHEATVHCLQMICENGIEEEEYSQRIEKLEDKDAAELENLINLVQPGYYSPGTRLMGEYYGIRQDGKLVAAAGERICLKEYTEISGVVTHPGFTGRKFAHQLVTHVTNKNRSTGLMPYLHVAQNNERAIRLYDKLGFTVRRKMDVWKIRKIK